MTSLHPHQLWMAAADAGYSSFDEMQEDARLKRAEQLLRERRESEARRHAIEVKLRKAMAAEQGEQRRRQQFKDRIKNVLAILAFIAAILLLWQSGAFGAPFASGERREKFRQLMPLAEYQRDDSVKYYTERDMPRAYQLPGVSNGSTTLHNQYENVAANPDGMPSNANAEAPWNKPGGMDRVHESSAYGVQFVRLPPGMPIIWWTEFRPDEYFDQYFETYRWRFPQGAAVGEMIVLRGPDGIDRVCEVRIRHRQARSWSVEIFRPFQSPADLANAITSLRPNWEHDAALRQAVEKLRSPADLRTLSYRSNHANPAVRLDYSRDVLPPIPADVVNELLERVEFQDVSGSAWRGEDCFAPTAREYSIVPVDYAAHAIGSDNESCRKCHSTVGRSARMFTPGREWYGKVRGSDNIFSYHPFDPRSIGGGLVVVDNVRGLIEHRDDRRHNPAHYQQLER